MNRLYLLLVTFMISCAGLSDSAWAQQENPNNVKIKSFERFLFDFDRQTGAVVVHEANSFCLPNGMIKIFTSEEIIDDPIINEIEKHQFRAPWQNEQRLCVFLNVAKGVLDLFEPTVHCKGGCGYGQKFATLDLREAQQYRIFSEVKAYYTEKAKYQRSKRPFRTKSPTAVIAIRG